jgi:hypothetical protein
VAASATGTLRLADAQENLPPATLTPVVEPTATPSLVPTATHMLIVEPTSTPTLVLDVQSVEPDDAGVAGNATDTPVPTSTIAPTPTATLVAAAMIRVESADVSFGEVNALGDIDPNVDRVTSYPAEGGAWYVKERAIRLTVVSTGPWTGTCWAATINGMTPSLYWRRSGEGKWSSLAESDHASTACFGQAAAGASTFEYDLRSRARVFHSYHQL